MIQTTVSYETRKLSDIEFPTYVSLVPTPGYNSSIMSKNEVDVWNMFRGTVEEDDNGTFLSWDWADSIEGRRERSI